MSRLGKEDREKLQAEVDNFVIKAGAKTPALTSDYDARREADQFAAFMAEPE